MKRELKLTESYFKKTSNIINYFVLPLMFLAIVGGIVIGSDGSEISVFLVIVAVFILLFGYWSFSKATKLLRGRTESFTLAIDDEKIIRSQDGFETIEINKKEISEIIEYEGSSIAIKADGGKKEITIPKEIESIDELRSTLHKWKPIELRSSSKTRNTIISFSLSGLGSIGFLIFLWSKNYYVVLISGSILLVLFIVGWFMALKEFQKSKSKQLFTWLYLVPIIIICLKMFNYFFYG